MGPPSPLLQRTRLTPSYPHSPPNFCSQHRHIKLLEARGYHAAARTLKEDGHALPAGPSSALPGPVVPVQAAPALAAGGAGRPTVATYNGRVPSAAQYPGMICFGCGRTGPDQAGCRTGCVNLPRGHDALLVPLSVFVPSALVGHRLYDATATRKDGKPRVTVTEARVPNRLKYHGHVAYLQDPDLFVDDAGRSSYVDTVLDVVAPHEAELLRRLFGVPVFVTPRPPSAPPAPRRQNDRRASPPRFERSRGRYDKGSYDRERPRSASHAAPADRDRHDSRRESEKAARRR